MNFASTQPAAAPTGTDPGKTLGILSIALCWLGFIATILGVIGLTKSKKAGYNGATSIIGISLSSVFLVLGALFSVGVVIGLLSFGSLQTYRDNSAGIELKLPSGWTINPTTLNSVPGIQALSGSGKPSADKDIRSGTVFTFCSSSTTIPISAKEFNDGGQKRYDAAVRAKAAADTYAPFKNLTVDGNPAVQIEYTYDGVVLKQRQQITYILEDNGKTVCNLSIFERNFDKPGPKVFDQADEIVASFKRLP